MGGSGRTKSGPTAQPGAPSASSATAVTDKSRLQSMVDVGLSSLVPERFDRIEARRAARRVEAEEDADCGREDESTDDRGGREQDRPARELGDRPRDRDAGQDARHAADA